MPTVCGTRQQDNASMSNSSGTGRKGFVTSYPSAARNYLGSWHLMELPAAGGWRPGERYT
jgi:hypothetical protein